MNYRGELLLLLQAGGRVRSACKNRRDVAVQKHRRELDRVARHDASIKPTEPAAVLNGMVANAISSRFGEDCVGHLVHADGARGGLIDREKIPGQAPPPIGSCYRITRTLDLREGGEQLGCIRRFGAKPDKKIVDRQAASPSSWKTPFMAAWM